MGGAQQGPGQLAAITKRRALPTEIILKLLARNVCFR